MGGYVSKFQALIWAKKETRILILGLVSALQCEPTEDMRLPIWTGQCGQDDSSVQIKGMQRRPPCRPQLR
jgi:hypothetical protein